MLDQCFEILRKEVQDDKKLSEAMDWMQEYVKAGASMCHAAAGQALAAAAVTALWLSENPEILQRMLYNPRDGQVGREDFRYAFALHSLLMLIQSYDRDDLSICREQLAKESAVGQVYYLVQELAYQGGEIAESLGLQKPEF